MNIIVYVSFTTKSKKEGTLKRSLQDTRDKETRKKETDRVKRYISSYSEQNLFKDKPAANSQPNYFSI